MKPVSEHACHGGWQRYFQHESSVIGLPMRFSVYEPPQASSRPVPALFYLAGLTCNEETFMIKAGAQRVAAELGILLVACDTSPRNTGIDGESADWEFGSGAGFYLNATEPPWSGSFRMYDYILRELRPLVVQHFPVMHDRVGIFGHSMGGHGALVLALRNPDAFQSVSAFAPICAPSECAWGRKAFSGYLGEDRQAWSAYDATQLMRSLGAQFDSIRIDQGTQDAFLEAGQLRPEPFEAACADAGQALELYRHAGYDHGYYFVSSFIEAQLNWHARYLCA